jgi:K+-transporting ATPase ATPase C chain
MTTANLFIKSLRPAASLLLAMTLLTGLAYPFAITGVARAIFADQAAGSLIVRDGKPVGSRLIGQSFSDPGHFWGRPSATAPQPYNAAASGGSNLGPLNPALMDQVQANAKALSDAQTNADQVANRKIPVDLVTASASGLDPEISPAGVLFQAARVAHARNLPLADVEALIARHTRGKVLGLFGEPRVNVLELNLALDTLRGQ